MARQVLSYQKNITGDILQVFQTVLNEQLKYFQFYDKTIKSLFEGLVIKKDFYTKTTKEQIKGSITITKIIPNQQFQICSQYGQNKIIQTFDFITNEQQTLIKYQEENMFNKKINKINFNLISIFYRFFFKYQMKKRMIFIEKQTQVLLQGEI